MRFLDRCPSSGLHVTHRDCARLRGSEAMRNTDHVTVVLCINVTAAYELPSFLTSVTRSSLPNERARTRSVSSSRNNGTTMVCPILPSSATELHQILNYGFRRRTSAKFSSVLIQKKKVLGIPWLCRTSGVEVTAASTKITFLVPITSEIIRRIGAVVIAAIKRENLETLAALGSYKPVAETGWDCFHTMPEYGCDFDSARVRLSLRVEATRSENSLQ